MKLVHRRRCGIDVHKDCVTACVLITGPDGRRTVRKKEFASYLRGLENLRLWLYANKVTQVGMESTGVYWKPVGANENLPARANEKLTTRAASR